MRSEVVKGVVMVDTVRSRVERILTVEADAIVRIPPDRVVINAGARTKGKSLSEIRQKNSIIIGNAIEMAKLYGVSTRNISTDHVRIDPKFDGDTERVEWYYVDQSVMIILEDISRYEELLSRLIDVGINEFHSVEFKAAELKKYRNNARVAAIAAAVEKANFLAKVAELKLGKIVNLSERTSCGFHSGRSNGQGNQVTPLTTQVPGEFYQRDESGDDEVMELGVISIQAFVTVHFELEG